MDSKNIFSQLKKEKVLFLLLILTVILGLYMRFDNYGVEGLIGDNINTIPAAVFAYYPHDYFPGLVSTEPPLGNYIIGLGCMASGEDFSGVSKVKPLFFPDRPAYLGASVKNAENYCWAPVYIFSVLFLLGIIVFAFSFFKSINSAAYFIALFSLHAGIIGVGRTLKVDIILYTFVIFAITFLWKAYDSKKGSKKEKIYIFIAFSLFGLGGGIKFPVGALIVFSFLIILEKYIGELLYYLNIMLKNIDINILDGKVDGGRINPKTLMVNAGIAIASATFFLMMVFNFSFKNLYDTYHYMTSLNFAGVQKLGFSISMSTHWLAEFVVKLSIIDTFIFIFSFYVLFRMIFKKNKAKQARFTLYFMLLGLFIITMFKSGIMASFVRSFPFVLGFFILLAFTFSNNEYSVFKTFNIKKKHFMIFFILYIIVAFIPVYYSPFHRMYTNPVYCSVFTKECKTNLGAFTVKPVGEYFDSVLNDDETFLTTGIYNMYTRHNDAIMAYMFMVEFQKQTGQFPGLEDYLEYYQPEGRRVRYIHTMTMMEKNPDDLVGILRDIEYLKRDYQSNHVIELYGEEAAYIFDLDNLIKK